MNGEMNTNKFYLEIAHNVFHVYDFNEKSFCYYWDYFLEKRYEGKIDDLIFTSIKEKFLLHLYKSNFEFGEGMVDDPKYFLHHIEDEESFDIVYEDPKDYCYNLNYTIWEEDEESSSDDDDEDL